MQITLKFFASVREATGMGESQHTTSAATVAELREELATSYPGWQVILSKQTQVAVNQQLCDDGQAVGEGDEVAFFPFMTGG